MRLLSAREMVDMMGLVFIFCNDYRQLTALSIYVQIIITVPKYETQANC